ncbi:MAG: ABC transporter ATP-binding protein [bacterium]|nr:ABC transporter ATP-binding protein [bacterium]
MKLYLRILRYIIPYIPGVLLSLLLALSFSAANIFYLPLTRDIVNELSHKNLVNFNNHIFNAVILYTILLISKHGQYYISNYISNKMSIDIQMDLYKKIQTFSASYYSKWKLGDILTRLFSDVEKSRDAVRIIFSDIIPQLITLTGIISYLFIMNWQLMSFSLLAIPLSVLILIYNARKLKKVARHVQRKTADITHIAQEVLSNIRIVQAYSMGDREIARFKRERIRNFKAIMMSIKINAVLEPAISLLQFVVYALVIWFGGYAVAKGHMTGASLASFFVGVILLIDPVLALSKVYAVIQQAYISTKRFYEIIDTELTIKNAPDAVIPELIRGDILFDNVSFAYVKNDDYVLKNIRLEAKKGEIIALVGMSGVGKSTLINLIPRFYDPTDGAVMLDGIDLRKIDLNTLRSSIGIVPQEDILFRGSIIENIRYGSPDANEDEVLEAAKKANAWDFIQGMKCQLYAKVEDMGRNLSGGQKQRISIARAILRNPRILILDEATSALDSESEKLVQDALYKLMENRTTFVIAHKLSTVMHADNIIVMENGRIKEAGTHNNLLDNKGLYSKLYEMQFQKTIQTK